jgi:hypothetical protein
MTITDAIRQAIEHRAASGVRLEDPLKAAHGIP